ncbi:MAG: hypothetical protein H8E55_46505 [Pelagibacterales bacterium]|nr:hypothetical protein [Pelagibacterales bacterium]
MKALIIIISSLFISTDNVTPEINKEVAVLENPYAKKKKNKRDAYYFIIMGIITYCALGLEKKKDE